MTRRIFIERALRQIFNGQPNDDANISYNLVNTWMSEGIALAARKNYTDNLQIEGIGYNNNGFYTNFKGLTITEDERSLYKFTLPEIPVGIGSSEGIARVVFKDANNALSYPAVMLTENQVAIQRQMRTIPNKILCYSEGKYCYVITPILMDAFTASVTMISGGDATDLDSELNVPPDYLPICVEYIKAQLAFEKAQIADITNDGRQN